MATAAPITGAPTCATPFQLSYNRYRVALGRFNALPRNFEDHNPAAYERYTGYFLETVEAVNLAPALDLREFAEGFLIACDDGASAFNEAVIDRLVADAKRLTGAA